MQTPMMSCHLICMWHEFNTNANDVMMTWFTSYANLVMSHLACITCTCVHGAHALCKNSMSKYPSGLACMQANSNLREIATSHFQELNTQNASQNMQNMIPIAYLNENGVVGICIFSLPMHAPPCLPT